MRLRITGESQRENVKKLLGTVPPIIPTGYEPAMKMDRGYGIEQQIVKPHVAQFEIMTICSMFGSWQPFVSQHSVDDHK